MILYIQDNAMISGESLKYIVLKLLERELCRLWLAQGYDYFSPIKKRILLVKTVSRLLSLK